MTLPQISFEFFPPRTIEASFRLHDAIGALAPLGPRFVSVTYGAGGTTRDLTQQAVVALQTNSGLNVAAHLTCVDASRDETLAIADKFAAAGVKGLVALRGDPPAGEDGFVPHPDGFRSSCELISALADRGWRDIRVGAYPNTHPEARDMRADIDWLKRKTDAGATEALTQFFFEADTFLRFRDACADAGITAPITPGILPIENWGGTKRFATRCGTPVPNWLADAFDKAERDDRHDLLAISVCTELCSDLMSEGVDNLHFYTLNKPHMTREVCQAIGLTPAVELRNVA
ncbi:MAG: methylenetetrahydrofolate reductase [NAD(P)H] [Paracoccaceae bacterium]